MKLRVGVVLLASSALLGLAACGGGDEGGDEAPASQAAETPVAPSDTAQERAGALPGGGEAGVTPPPVATEGATPGQMNAPQSPAEAAGAAGGATGGGPSAAAGGAVVLAGFTGDPARGQRVFVQCRTCHTVQPGVNRVGPSLHGIVGRQSGTIPGFRYSPANQNSNVTWTEPVLFEYLENPREFMPGTFMSFTGVRDPQQRADLIAYLKSASATTSGGGRSAAAVAPPHEVQQVEREGRRERRGDPAPVLAGQREAQGQQQAHARKQGAGRVEHGPVAAPARAADHPGRLDGDVQQDEVDDAAALEQAAHSKGPFIRTMA